MFLSKHLISQHSIAVKSCGNQTIPHTVKINARFAKPARSMGGLNIRTILRRKLDVMRTQDTSMKKRKSQRNKQWKSCDACVYHLYSHSHNHYILNGFFYISSTNSSIKILLYTWDMIRSNNSGYPTIIETPPGIIGVTSANIIPQNHKSKDLSFLNCKLPYKSSYTKFLNEIPEIKSFTNSVKKVFWTV